MDEKPTAEEILTQVKIAFPWMLTSLKHGADETSGGNYSDELKHAILTGELVEGWG